MDNRNNAINNNNNNNNHIEIPLFETEEGRYLASALGDPLIKGLTEVANNRPTDPVTYLADYLQEFAIQKRMSITKNDDENQINDNRSGGGGGGGDEEDSSNLDNIENQQYISNALGTELLKTETFDNTIEEPPLTPDDTESITSNDERDEHGQSMLHFACARSHGRNALVQLIEESGVSITYRDELYRTARDVSLQASQSDNAREIDRYVLSLAARGDLDAFQNMTLDGYDHIVNVKDKEDNSIIDIGKVRGHIQLVEFLEGVREFEETREKLHKAIRDGDIDEVKNISELNDGQKLMRAKNYFGRCSLHIAILKENEEIVDYIATNFRQTLKLGDNLERTPLHYAMGVGVVEALSRILIKNGAKRVVKDLKGRQPSYYFMNKADILRLQEEEEDDDDD